MIVQDDSIADSSIAEKKRKKNSKGLDTYLPIFGTKQLQKGWPLICQLFMVQDQSVKIFSKVIVDEEDHAGSGIWLQGNMIWKWPMCTTIMIMVMGMDMGKDILLTILILELWRPEGLFPWLKTFLQSFTKFLCST